MVAERSLIQCTSCTSEVCIEEYELKKFNSKNRFYCKSCLNNIKENDDNISGPLISNNPMMSKRLPSTGTIISETVKYYGNKDYKKKVVIIKKSEWGGSGKILFKNVHCPNCKSWRISHTEGATINNMKYFTCQNCSLMFTLK